MLLDRKKYSEFGYIGEDFLNDKEKDHVHKCMVVEQSIADGDFSLAEALQAYQLSKEDYEEYVAKTSNANIFHSLSGDTYPSVNTSYALPFYIEVFAKMLETSFDKNISTIFYGRVQKITEELKEISNDIRELEHKP